MQCGTELPSNSNKLSSPPSQLNNHVLPVLPDTGNPASLISRFGSEAARTLLFFFSSACAVFASAFHLGSVSLKLPLRSPRWSRLVVRLRRTWFSREKMALLLKCISYIFLKREEEEVVGGGGGKEGRRRARRAGKSREKFQNEPLEFSKRPSWSWWGEGGVFDRERRGLSGGSGALTAAFRDRFCLGRRPGARAA